MAEHTSTLFEQQQQRTTIYALIDPQSGLVKYIGKAIDPVDRLRRHLVDANRRYMRCCRWISKLLRCRLKPLLHIIEECDGDGAAEEIFHIRLARQDGLKLCNATVGGEGCTGYKHTEVSRLKMSVARKGIPKSEEFKAMVSRTSMGRKMPRDSVERGAAKRRGRKLAAWQIELLRNANTGRKKSREESFKHAAYLRSIPKSEWARRAKTRERFFVTPWTKEDGQQLLARRKATGARVGLVAQLAGIHESNITRYEKALRRPRKTNLARVEAALLQLETHGYTPERARAERAAIRTARRWPKSPMSKESWSIPITPPISNGYH